jgi:hypothetical protein
MKLCKTSEGGLSLFEILDDRGRIIWRGARRDEVEQLLWASGARIPECIPGPSGDFQVEISWVSPRVAESKDDLLTSVDRMLSTSLPP